MNRAIKLGVLERQTLKLWKHNNKYSNETAGRLFDNVSGQTFRNWCNGYVPYLKGRRAERFNELIRPLMVKNVSTIRNTDRLKSFLLSKCIEVSLSPEQIAKKVGFAGIEEKLMDEGSDYSAIELSSICAALGVQSSTLPIEECEAKLLFIDFAYAKLNTAFAAKLTYKDIKNISNFEHLDSSSYPKESIGPLWEEEFYLIELEDNRLDFMGLFQGTKVVCKLTKLTEVESGKTIIFRNNEKVTSGVYQFRPRGTSLTVNYNSAYLSVKTPNCLVPEYKGDIAEEVIADPLRKSWAFEVVHYISAYKPFVDFGLGEL